MRAALLALLLLALASAHAADTPLSAILIDGEGWRPALETIDIRRRANEYAVKKDADGRWGVYKGDRLLAQADAGETWGEAAASPGGGQLVVGVPSHHHLWAFQVAKDGSLYAKEKTYALRKERPGKGGSGVKNMAFDSKGRLFAAVPEGVVYFDEEMRFSGQLSRPARAPVGWVALIGDHLYVECGGALWKRKIKATAP